MGSYLTIINNTPDVYECTVGPDEQALHALGVGITTLGIASLSTAPLTLVSAPGLLLGTLSSVSIAIAHEICDLLRIQRSVAIAPHSSHRFGKMSLSLWQQATCVKTTSLNATVVRMETVCLRPIFSGATHNANLDYEIQRWIDRHGHDTNDALIPMAIPKPQ